VEGRPRVSEPLVSTPRVVLADNDAPTRVGLRVALGADGFDVVAEAPDAEAAISAALELEPDAVLVAAALPGGGIEAARRIVAGLPRVRVVIVSDDPGGEELLNAVLAGASGHLGSACPPPCAPSWPVRSRCRAATLSACSRSSGVATCSARS
jgi:DNA-binding NarL/FixJ family response regulator